MTMCYLNLLTFVEYHSVPYLLGEKKANPFQFRHLKLCHSMAEVNKVGYASYTKIFVRGTGLFKSRHLGFCN